MSINGSKIPDDLLNPNISAEELEPAYAKYLKEKAHEPKSSWLTSSIYPTIIGTALAGTVFTQLHNKNILSLVKDKKMLWPLAGIVGTGIGSVGALLKIKDDDKIMTARKLNQRRTFDKDVKNIVKYVKDNYNNKSEMTTFLNNPSIKNLHHIPAIKDLLANISG